MKFNFQILLILSVSMSFVQGQWNGINCSTDNNGNGWDSCICNGSICESCTVGNYYQIENNTENNHCCDISCSYCQNSQDSKICSICAEGYYKIDLTKDNSYCSKCSNECLECTSINQCQTCLRETNNLNGYQHPFFQQGFVSYLQNGSCLTDSCQLNCDRCYYNQQNLECYGCSTNYYLQNKECKKCPQNCNSCSIDNLGDIQCQECKNPNQSINNNCQEDFTGFEISVLDGYYTFKDYEKNQVSILKCQSGCQRCYYDYTNQKPFCQACEQISGENRKSLPNCGCKSGFFETSDLQCLQCQKPCLTCQNDSTQCLACAGLYRDIGLNCACQPGYKENSALECEPVLESWEQKCYENLLYLSEDNIKNSCVNVIDTDNDNKIRYDFQIYFENFILDDTCFDQVLFFENSPQTFTETQNHKLIFSQYHEDLIELGCQYNIGISEYTWVCNIQLVIYWNGVKQRTHNFKMISSIQKLNEEYVSVDLSKTLQEENCCENPLEIYTQLNVCTDSSCEQFEQNNSGEIFQFSRNVDIYFQISILTNEFIHYYLESVSLKMGQMILNPEGVDSRQQGKIIYHIRPSLAVGQTTLSAINQLIDPNDPNFNNIRRNLNGDVQERQQQKSLILSEKYYLKTQSSFNIIQEDLEKNDEKIQQQQQQKQESTQNNNNDEQQLITYKIILICAISVVVLLIIILLSVFLYKYYKKQQKIQRKNLRTEKRNSRRLSSRSLKNDDSNTFNKANFIFNNSNFNGSNNNSKELESKESQSININTGSRRGSILADMSKKYVTQKSKSITRGFTQEIKEELPSIQSVQESNRKNDKYLGDIILETNQSGFLENSKPKNYTKNIQEEILISENNQEQGNISNIKDKMNQKEIENKQDDGILKEQQILKINS